MYQFAFALYSIKVSMAIRKQWDGVVVCIPSPHLSHPSISPITQTRPQKHRFSGKIAYLGSENHSDISHG